MTGAEVRNLMTQVVEGVTYNVVDGHTKFVVGTYSTMRRAMRAADRKDLAYGAVRYRVEKVVA